MENINPRRQLEIGLRATIHNQLHHFTTLGVGHNQENNLIGLLGGIITTNPSVIREPKTPSN